VCCTVGAGRNAPKVGVECAPAAAAHPVLALRVRQVVRPAVDLVALWHAAAVAGAAMHSALCEVVIYCTRV
jgi:hypothetical protein